MDMEVFDRVLSITGLAITAFSFIKIRSLERAKADEQKRMLRQIDIDNLNSNKSALRNHISEWLESAKNMQYKNCLWVSDKVLAYTRALSDGYGKFLDSDHKQRESIIKATRILGQLESSLRLINHCDVEAGKVGDVVRHMTSVDAMLSQKEMFL